MMNEEMVKRYHRMNDRLIELGRINSDIARLAFYINENEVDKDYACQLDAQLEAMVKYRNILEERIGCGNY